jgi:aminoacyl tRNA synthase complex-interacting multifunctional protein 1
MDSSAYYSVPAVTRYFDHIQHLKPVVDARSLLQNSPYVLKEFDLDNMPPLERKVEVKEKKAKKATADGVQPAAAAAAAATGKEGKKGKDANKDDKAPPAGAAAAAGKEGEGKKDKQPKEKKEKKPAAAPAAPAAPAPSMIDLRVGKVLEGESLAEWCKTMCLGVETQFLPE